YVVVRLLMSIYNIPPYSYLCPLSPNTSICLLFITYPVLRVPHSFPTRRSSDLVAGPPMLAHKGMREGVTVTEIIAGKKPHAIRRSEEHTSELQSPDHLVCRLLLEKKKRQKMNR